MISLYKNNILFFIKFVLVLITVCLLDFSLGSLLKILYFKQESGLQYRATYSIEKTEAKVLIFGSSTANHNYQPEIFQQRLNTSVYNVGADGSSIFYDYAVLKAILARHKPNMIILSFDRTEFVKNQASYDQLTVLLPYYQDHKEIRSLIMLKSPYEKYKLLSHIYPYNSSVFTMVGGNMDFNKKRMEDIDGYVPLDKIWTEKLEPGGSLVAEIDTVKIDFFKSFIADCLDHNVKLYIISSPIFIKPGSTSNSILLGKEISKSLNVPFFDFSEDSVFLNNRESFADISHLNDVGARIFSEKVIDIILGKSGRALSSNN